MKSLLAAAFLAGTLLSPGTDVAFGQAEPEPFGATPSEAQLVWHRLEFYGFIHFGANTFTNREWGNGDEPPSTVAPTELDCAQWARVAKSAGMKGLILTAKHHDGLCLWPTATTEHNISKSPLQNGKADLVRDLAAACAAEGLKFGVYLSPWDRNNAAYGKPEYPDIYRAQLTELLTNYGSIFEVWHDGANGGTGYYGGANEDRKIDKLTYYGWPQTRALVTKLQPQAIIFSDAGPHCRWVGNENGITPETSWQTIDNKGRVAGLSYDDLGSGKEGGADWVGPEADVSIRPGWFYHNKEDRKSKNAAALLDIWFKSVGRGSNLILNIPPDTRGLIHETDAQHLAQLGTILSTTFATNLAADALCTASSDFAGSSPTGARTLDANPITFWAARADDRTASLTYRFAHAITFDVIRIEEAIQLGQRVKSFRVLAREEPSEKEIARGTTIGPRRVIRLDHPVTTQVVRIEFIDTLAAPVISEFSLHTLAPIPE